MIETLAYEFYAGRWVAVARCIMGECGHPHWYPIRARHAQGEGPCWRGDDLAARSLESLSAESFRFGYEV